MSGQEAAQTPTPFFLSRIAFAVEFLLALIAIFETWSMAGGQGHLDVMPWYAKLTFPMVLALLIVTGTASATFHERAWNARTLACVLLAALVVVGMGLTTYYWHLHENDDRAGGDDGSITFLHLHQGDLR